MHIQIKLTKKYFSFYKIKFPWFNECFSKSVIFNCEMCASKNTFLKWNVYREIPEIVFVNSEKSFSGATNEYISSRILYVANVELISINGAQ